MNCLDSLRGFIRETKRRIIVGLLLVVLLALSSAVFGEIRSRREMAECLNREKSLGLACKIYATDHEGHFPNTLEDLVPRYLTARNIFVCPFFPDVKMGYDYFGGTDMDNPANILIRSKMTFHGGHRAIVFVDCSGYISEEH